MGAQRPLPKVHFTEEEMGSEKPKCSKPNSRSEVEIDFIIRSVWGSLLFWGTSVDNGFKLLNDK